jgi:hypothetical protein
MHENGCRCTAQRYLVPFLKFKHSLTRQLDVKLEEIPAFQDRGPIFYSPTTSNDDGKPIIQI